MMSLKKFVQKALRINRILIIILFLSFLVRIPRLDYPLSFGFAWGDGTRDFLVANHIVKYREFPLVGPTNLLSDSGIKNSPVYFYLLALMLIPFNNILMLSLINILLQILVITLVYKVAKNLFDTKTALISALFYSFNWEVLHQSDFIWQPNLMLPFMLLSTLFLTLGKLKRSGFFLALAFAIHNSSFSWIGPILILSFGHYLGVFAVFLLSTLLFYLPVLKFNTYGEYFSNLLSNGQQILTALDLNNSIGVALLGILIALYFLKIKESKFKLTFLLLILAILPIIFASFFNKIRIHYLILSIPPAVIFIARLIAMQKDQALLRVLTLIFFIIISSNFKFLTSIAYPLQNQIMINNISKVLKNELENIQKNNGYQDFSFFQIRSYALDRSVFDYPVLDTILIIPLENRLNQKLAKVSDDSFFNHVQKGKMDYILVACHQFSGEFNNEDCLKEFSTQYPQHAILKNLYTGFPISVYLAKHE